MIFKILDPHHVAVPQTEIWEEQGGYYTIGARNRGPGMGTYMGLNPSYRI